MFSFLRILRDVWFNSRYFFVLSGNLNASTCMIIAVRLSCVLELKGVWSEILRKSVDEPEEIMRGDYWRRVWEGIRWNSVKLLCEERLKGAWKMEETWKEARRSAGRMKIQSCRFEQCLQQTGYLKVWASFWAMFDQNVINFCLSFSTNFELCLLILCLDWTWGNLQLLLAKHEICFSKTQSMQI
jgi:hypothetical protein